MHSSTQHPTEVQHVCAQVLGCDFNRVTTVVRRLGGGFGGKESNASWVAAAAALGAAKTGKPVKLRLPREIDIIATGKRHGFDYRYTVGFDDEGRVLALDAMLAADAGWSLDMTPGVVARALTHVDNAYWIPHVRAVGYSCRTNKQSNTAFRGFGGPQGVLVMEDAIDRIARHLGRDANEIRALNFYGAAGDETPYGQKVDENHLARCWAEVKQAGEWERRRAEVDAFNQANPVLKRGLGLFPLKFGISFNIPHMNQAGALVHVYTDGSIRLNHGGTEMGQGLFIKVAQVVAEVFKVDIDRIRPSATSTAEVPNTSPTAASTGSDLNGWAAWEAANTIKQRMVAFAAEHFGVAAADIEFADGNVRIAKPGSNQVMSFGEMAKLCYLGRVSLSSTGFYKTPKVHWDGAAMRGRPFFYFSFGAAMAEVAIDTLTGESRVLRADLVQDCGASLNPAIDLGQIEGAFVQGQGWLTCEELWWDKQGRLRTVGPSTYKIPGSRDVPADLQREDAGQRALARSHDLPLQGRRRAAAAARHRGMDRAQGCDRRRDGQQGRSAPRCAGYARARPRGDRDWHEQPLDKRGKRAVHRAPRRLLILGLGDPERGLVESAGQQERRGLDRQGIVGSLSQHRAHAFAQRAHAVRRVDLAPAMPAQHGGRVDQVDAAHRGIEAGIEEGAGSDDEGFQRIVHRCHGIDLLGDLARHLACHGIEQRALVLEMMIERAARHLGAPHDLFGGCGGVTLFGEDGPRRLEQRGTRGGQPSVGRPGFGVLTYIQPVSK